MIIQGKEFEEGQLIVYVDSRHSNSAGAGGCFQISDITIDGEDEESILDQLKIDMGFHYLCEKDVLDDLDCDPDAIDYRFEYV